MNMVYVLLVIMQNTNDNILIGKSAKENWLIVTEISISMGWSAEAVQQRETEMKKVAELIGFEQVYNLRLPSAQLDQIKTIDLINQFSKVFKKFEPEEVLLPYRS
jgi:N-acetylglucosamine malate deacetylase 1